MLLLPLEKAPEFELSSALDSLRGSVPPWRTPRAFCLGGWAWDKDIAGTPVLQACPRLEAYGTLATGLSQLIATACCHLMRAKGEGTAGVADVPRIPDSREGWMVSPPSHT